MKRQVPILRLACCFGLMAGPLFGQGRVRVTGIAESGGSITLTLQNTASIPATGLSASFRMEGSPTLALGTWEPVGAGPFTPVAGPSGFYSTTFLRPAGTKYFYRFLGMAAAVGDADGDVLSDAFEPTILPVPTSGTLFDSDFDGFSDGEEFTYGTDPNDASKKPIFFQSVPTVNFNLATSTATEGAATHQVQILFDRSYSGTVNYAINTMSNTVAGTDYAPVSGSLPMTGGNSAFIPITPIDDASVSGQRVIIIDLKLNGENYFIGGCASHVVLLNDNDSLWTGTLVPASGETSNRIFRVKVAHQGAATTAVFGAGAGNDGLPVPVAGTGGVIPTTGASGSGGIATITFSGGGPYRIGSSVTVSGVAPAGYNGTWVVTASSPVSVSYSNNTTAAQTTAGTISTPPISDTSISTSMIPAGSWLATGVVDNAAQFHAESPVLIIAAGSICNQPLGRRLVLNSQPALNSATHPHLLEGIRDVGDYTETLTSPTGALLATLPGSFILVRDIPAPLPVLSPLVPVP